MDYSALRTANEAFEQDSAIPTYFQSRKDQDKEPTVISIIANKRKEIEQLEQGRLKKAF